MSPRLRSPAEILGRLRQAGTIVAERAGLAPRGVLPGDGARRPRLPFPTPSPEQLGTIYAERPSERMELLAQAENALGGKLALLGYEALSFGTPIDWHADPLRGRRAPEGHWSTIPYLDSERVGDHKLIWELNRHQWLVTLAQAGCLTGDPRYLEGAAARLSEWLDRNPPRSGINWASSLEAAFRGISWTWVLHLAGNHPAFGPALTDRLLTSLDLHGRHVESHLSTWFSPNTHLTGEALGLLYLGCAWPGYPRAAAWRRAGWEILLQQLPMHLRRDGTYFEQSTWYLAYTLDFYLHATLLGAQEGWSFPASHRERLVAGSRALAEFMRPDGTLSLVGDDDGGRLLPLAPGARTGFGDTLALAASVLGVPDLGGRTETPAAVAWITGAKEWRAIARPGRATASPTGALPDGGWYFLRSAQGSLSLDAGPHGIFGHAHADALSITLELAGRPVIVDAGTYSYVGPERDAFRGPGGHSSLTLNGEASARPAGPFSWARRADATVHHWAAGGSWDFIEASHDGFEDRYPGVRHFRAVFRWQEAGWLVMDRLSGTPAHGNGELRFLLAPDWSLSAGDSDFEARHPTGRLLITTDGQGTNVTESAWVSGCYGRRMESRAAIRRVAAIGLAVGTGTLLTPGPGPAALCRSEVEDGVEWRWDTADAAIIALARNAAAARVRSGSLASTARFCLVVTVSGSSPAMLGAQPGEVLDHDRPLPRLERFEPRGAR